MLVKMLENSKQFLMLFIRLKYLKLLELYSTLCLLIKINEIKKQLNHESSNLDKKYFLPYFANISMKLL